MEISLSAEYEAYLQAKVEAGEAFSYGDMISQALDVYREHEEIRLQKLRAFQDSLDEAIAQADRGECVDGETAIREIEEELEQLIRQERERSSTQTVSSFPPIYPDQKAA